MTWSGKKLFMALARAAEQQDEELFTALARAAEQQDEELFTARSSANTAVVFATVNPPD